MTVTRSIRVDFRDPLFDTFASSPRGTIRPDCVVVHYAAGTKGGDPDDIETQLKRYGFSYNDLVEADGVVRRLVDPELYASHAGGRMDPVGAGTSYPHGVFRGDAQAAGRSARTPDGAPLVNSRSIGVALCYPGPAVSPRSDRVGVPEWPHPKLGPVYWPRYPDEQIEGAVLLVAQHCRKFGIDPARIYPHGNHPEGVGIVAHKADPGPMFPLAEFRTRVAAYL